MTDPYLRDASGRIVALKRDNPGLPIRPVGPWSTNAVTDTRKPSGP